MDNLQEAEAPTYSDPVSWITSLRPPVAPVDKASQTQAHKFSLDVRHAVETERPQESRPQLSTSQQQLLKKFFQKHSKLVVGTSGFGQPLFQVGEEDVALTESLQPLFNQALRHLHEGATGTRELTLSNYHFSFEPLRGPHLQGYLASVRLVPGARISQKLPLTRRQSEICQLAIEGHTVPEMAEKLRISANTVKAHLKRVYELAQVSSRVELARVFAE